MLSINTKKLTKSCEPLLKRFILKIYGYRALGKGGGEMTFPCKIGTHKIFTCEEHMRLEFIY